MHWKYLQTLVLTAISTCKHVKNTFALLTHYMKRLNYVTVYNVILHMI